MPISVNTVAEPAPISIDTGIAGDPEPSDNTATIRAGKTDLGLAPVLGISGGDIYQMYKDGKEQEIRNQAASAIDMKKAADQNLKLIQTVAKNPDITAEQVNALRPIPTDPKSVVEDAYSKSYVNNIYNAAFNIEDTWMDDAMTQFPDQTLKTKEIATGMLSQREYAMTRVQDIQDVIEKQATLPWVLDQAKQVVPFYSAWKLRGWMESVPAYQGVLTGNNLYEQTRALLRLPYAEFKTKFDEIIGKLLEDNPTLAAQYAQAVVGMSTGDQALHNAMNILDIASIPGTALSTLKLARNFNRMRVGFQDIVRSARAPRPDAATMAEGAGDVGEAAVQRAASNLRADIDGIYRPTDQPYRPTPNDPITRGRESLPTGFRTDRQKLTDDFESNPDALSRELQVRVENGFINAENNIVDTVFNTAKVQRISIEQATVDQVRELKRALYNQNPSIQNMIADIGDPVHNPASNTWIWPVKLFRWSAEQFTTEAEAKASAKLHGILEYDISGNASNKFYIPEAAVKRPWEGEPRFGEAIVKDGEFRYFTADGAEVQPTVKPQINHIPVEIKDGKPIFHPTIKTEADLTRAVVEQQGLGFHLTTWKELNENDHLARDLMLHLDSAQSSASRPGYTRGLNSFIGYIRGSDDTLSPLESHARKTATYAMSRYQALLQGEMQKIEDVARGRIRVNPVTGKDINPIYSKVRSLLPDAKYDAKRVWSEFNRTLKAAQKADNPETGKPGYFLPTVSELNHFYQSNFQRFPTFREVDAYQAIRRNYENDRVFRQLRVYTNKARLGTEQHQFTTLDQFGDRVNSGFFEGVRRKELPGGEDPILIVHGNGKYTYTLPSKLGAKYKEYAKDVREGRLHAIEVYDPEMRPLSGLADIGNEYVRYVVAPNMDSKPLDWQQVTRQSGGHFVHDYSHWVKEARMTKTIIGNTVIDRYEGDITFMPVKGNAQGQQIIKVLNEVKRLMVAKKMDEAKELLSQFPMPWKEWKSQFVSKKVNGVTVPPRLNVKEPFYVVPEGGSIVDMDKTLEHRYTKDLPNGTRVTTFKDGTRSGSLARQFQVDFTRERESERLMTLNIEGTKNNPIYKYEPAEFLDPITTMNRALNRIVSTSFMDDYKIQSIEGWLREAGPYLKASESELRSAPFYHYMMATRKSFKPDAPFQIVENLMSNRFKGQQFIGMPSRFDTAVHEVSQKLADASFDLMGPKGALVPAHLLPRVVKDPVRVLRSLAYHTKIGLWSIGQIITQSQSMLTIGSVSPRSVSAGTLGTLFHEWAGYNRSPEFLDLLDKYATKLKMPGLHSWKTGEWKEANIELNRRGFANVGGEFSPLDTQLNHSFINNEFGAALNVADIFFRGTEQRVRTAAWYTAWKEARADKPTGEFSMAQKDAILDRADLLAGNMSRASSSILHSGPLSLTAQFAQYQIRLAELFWGKRLGDTTGERSMARARMIAAYTLMAGVPGVVGLGGIPADDYVRKTAMKYGYNVGENWMSSFLMEGVVALAGAFITGKGDIQAGNWYNVSSKLGAGGFSQLKQLWSDAKWYELLGGVSTSILTNTIKNMSGFWQSTMSMLTAKTKDQEYPMKIDDWVDMFKEITSVNQAWKGYMAVRFGKWLSKNEAYQADVSKINGIFMAVTNMNLTEAADNYNVSQLVKDQEDQYKVGVQGFIKNFHRALDMKDDPQQYKDYMRKAYGYFNAYEIPDDMQLDTIAKAAKGYETQMQSIRESFFTKNVPTSQEGSRRQAYENWLKLQRKRELPPIEVTPENK